MVLTKIDLADPAKTKQWLDFWQSQGEKAWASICCRDKAWAGCAD